MCGVGGGRGQKLFSSEDLFLAVLSELVEECDHLLEAPTSVGATFFFVCFLFELGTLYQNDIVLTDIV